MLWELGLIKFSAKIMMMLVRFSLKVLRFTGTYMLAVGLFAGLFVGSIIESLPKEYVATSPSMSLDELTAAGHKIEAIQAQIAYTINICIYGGLAIGAILAFTIFIIHIVRFVKTGHPFLHGKASKQENQKSPAPAKTYRTGFPTGVVFGKYHSSYVVKPEGTDGHALIIGGQGSGKSAGIAIPTLLSWKSSAFVIDIKGELEAKSNRPKKKTFNPLNPDTYGFDPFEVLHGSKNRAQDARQIAIAIHPVPTNIKDPYWAQSAQDFLTASILHFSLNNNFISTMKLILQTPSPEIVKQVSNSSDEAARTIINQFIGLDIKTLSSIYSELANKTTLFSTDSDIMNALNKHENISPIDLESNTDVFIRIPEDKIEQWKPVLTLIINQFLTHFERRTEGTKDNAPVPVLFMLDEFARLGSIYNVINGLATLRSKKITIMILTQSLAQLDDIYGQAKRKVIADNCNFKAILSATDADTQEYFSRIVGTYDREKKSKSKNYQQYTGIGTGQGTTYSTMDARIIKPEEFAYLKDDIVFISPLGFCRLKKTYWFKDRIFKILGNACA